MSTTLIQLLSELTEDECLTNEEDKIIEYLIEILNSYEIKTPEDLENKLKESEKSKSTKKPTKKNESDTSLSKIMNEIAECFFDSGRDVHVSSEKEGMYVTTLSSLYYLFCSHKINTIHDLKDIIEKSLHTNSSFERSSHKIPEDTMANVLPHYLDDLIEILNRENYCIVSKNNLATLVTQEEKENYAKILVDIRRILVFYEILYIDDLKDALRKSLTIRLFKKESHTISEDDATDVALSMATAFHETGGKIPNFDELKNISAFEFIKRIAPNRIRFCVIDKE